MAPLKTFTTKVQLVDDYVDLRAKINELSRQAKDMVADLPEGRYLGTAKDLRVSMAWNSTRSGGRYRRVAIVDKLKEQKA